VSGLFDPDVMLAGPAPRGLGMAMAGSSVTTPRVALDYYPTPPEATRALLRAETGRLAIVTEGGAFPIWEMAGRGDAIASEIRKAGFRTVATDIIADPTHGVDQADFLRTDAPLSPFAISNPPFAIAHEFIVHALAKLELRYLALLLKSSFWHASSRTELFDAYPPARRYDLNWRLDFMNKGAPVMECSWFVWDGQTTPGQSRYTVLRKDEAAPSLFDAVPA
jgi:hypothetical protein